MCLKKIATSGALCNHAHRDNGFLNYAEARHDYAGTNSTQDVNGILLQKEELLENTQV